MKRPRGNVYFDVLSIGAGETACEFKNLKFREGGERGEVACLHSRCR